jgi:acetolactate synthase-1/2/3 large subunit
MRKILKHLNTKINKKQNSEWNKKIDEWKELYPLKFPQDGLRANFILERMYEITKGEAIITTEVGQHQMWAAQFYKYKAPRQFISSGGLGTMGYGLGACIGAQIGMPDKKVINIAGDGSFRMNCNELATAVEYKLPVIIAVFNNHVLGMVRQWQNLFYDGRYSSTTIDRTTDFVALAKAFGAIGINVTRPEEVDNAVEAALASKDTPVLINFEIDRDDKVFPIVPPGAPINELIEE